MGMTVMAPHESKMFEAMIQSLDPASGTAKVKFAKVSFRNGFFYSKVLCKRKLISFARMGLLLRYLTFLYFWKQAQFLH